MHGNIKGEKEVELRFLTISYSIASGFSKEMISSISPTPFRCCYLGASNEALGLLAIASRFGKCKSYFDQNDPIHTQKSSHFINPATKN